MATFNATITASADDAQEANNTVTLTDAVLNVNATTQFAGIRFQNVTIPAGSTITAATLTFYFISGSYDDPYLTIKGNDVDDAAAFSAVNNDVSSRTMTTASVTWDQNSVGIGLETSPDISAVVQEIIDRGGWSSGNSIAFILAAIDNSSTFRVRAYDGTTDTFPTLDITYTPGSGGSGQPPRSLHQFRQRVP